MPGAVGQHLSSSCVKKTQPRARRLSLRSMAGDMATADMMTLAGRTPAPSSSGTTAPIACVPADSAKTHYRFCSPSTSAHSQSSRIRFNTIAVVQGSPAESAPKVV